MLAALPDQRSFVQPVLDRIDTSSEAPLGRKRLCVSSFGSRCVTSCRECVAGQRHALCCAELRCAVDSIFDLDDSHIICKYDSDCVVRRQSKFVVLSVLVAYRLHMDDG